MTVQNLINELVNDYIRSKYNKKYLEEKINEILEFILPHITTIIKNNKEKEIVKLWDITKEDDKIKNLFRKLVKKVDRPIVIYVVSKFENNKYFGTRIIEEALKWK